MVGLNREGRWTEDESAVLRAYQRHLLQVRFADALLGDVLAQLRHVGLYDDALVVVTSDHGASFQSDFYGAIELASAEREGLTPGAKNFPFKQRAPVDAHLEDLWHRTGHQHLYKQLGDRPAHGGCIRPNDGSVACPAKRPLTGPFNVEKTRSDDSKQMLGGLKNQVRR